MSIVHIMTDTSPAVAGTVIGDKIGRLDAYDSITVVATLQGATGGVLDVYLQAGGPDDGSVWWDIAHFPQLAAGAVAVSYQFALSRGTAQDTLTAVGTGTASAATPALAEGMVLTGDFGDRMRAVYVAGASTSAGAAQAIRVFGTLTRV